MPTGWARRSLPEEYIAATRGAIFFVLCRVSLGLPELYKTACAASAHRRVDGSSRASMVRQAEVDALFERRREMELAYMESKQKRCSA